MSNKKDTYQFWAVFEYGEDGVSVEFPDLPGCLTCGDDADEAYRMAQDALKLHLYEMENDNESVPEPTSLQQLLPTVGKNQVLIDVRVIMPPFREAMNNKVIKKTLTLPKWLNDLAEERGINFSQLLQYALKQHLGIQENR